MGYSPWSSKELGMTKLTHTHPAFTVCRFFDDVHFDG